MSGSLAVKDFPCGCRHNGFAETVDSSICDEHFREHRLHFCPESDYALIDKRSAEFDSCICRFPDVKEQ
jgi:hypothetical protein